MAGTTAIAHVIDCVTKDDRLDPYHRIVRVGGPNLPGIVPPDASTVLAPLRRRGLSVSVPPRWTLSASEAIEGILSGRWTFRVNVGAYDVVDVHVAISVTGQPFLRTDRDPDTPDELLFLPQCR